MATKENVSRFQAGVSSLELPKSFQDAVTVTLRLGLNYLWIDSLCIIQNDANDWAREAHNMSSVYGNAHFTLAASHALDSSQGLFSPRPIVRQAPVISIPIPADGQGSSDGELLIAADHFGSLDGGSPKLGRLSTRAWCYQEEMLSRRLIWFTWAEVIWDCNKEAISETGLCKRTSRHSSTGELGFSERFTNWQLIVEQYSRRHLSYAKDRPVALLGLAEKAKQWHKHSSYHHGIWLGGISTARSAPNATSSPNFPHQLLWSRDYIPLLGDFSMDLEPLCLPSWSWLSIPAPVKYVRRWDTLQEHLHCIRQSDFAYRDPGILLARGHFLSAPRSSLENHRESSILYNEYVYDHSMRLETLWKDAGPDTSLYGGLLATLAMIFELRMLEELDLEDQAPSIYLSRIIDGERQICGWIVLDDPHHASNHASDTEMALWVLPAVTWTLPDIPADERTVFHQVLVLEDRPDLATAGNAIDTIDGGAIGQHLGTYEATQGPKGPLRRIGIGYLTGHAGAEVLARSASSSKPIQRAIV